MEALARLQHPNIVKLLSMGKTPQVYFTMEYVSGRNLDGVVGRKKGKEIARIFQKIALALYAENDVA